MEQEVRTLTKIDWSTIRVGDGFVSNDRDGDWSMIITHIKVSPNEFKYNEVCYLLTNSDGRIFMMKDRIIILLNDNWFALDAPAIAPDVVG